jgi:uncharacterized protein YabN with tetrapyrrole methylase and pyrophosphatase domain
MPGELSSTRLKTVTNNLIDKIISNLEKNEDLKDSLKKATIDWWTEHKVEIVGLSIKRVIEIIKSANNKNRMTRMYMDLVMSMSWEQRIKFLEMGSEQIKTVSNKKFKEASLIISIMNTSIKLLPLILAAL